MSIVAPHRVRVAVNGLTQVVRRREGAAIAPHRTHTLRCITTSIENRGADAFGFLYIGVGTLVHTVT